MNVYRCPCEKTNLIQNYSLRAQKLTSYLMNGRRLRYGGVSPGSYKATQFKPNDIILWQAFVKQLRRLERWFEPSK
jgi:hypothetical protein